MTYSSSDISRFPPDNAPKSARFCYATGRRFEPGEKIYSVLYEESQTLLRRDYCKSAWKTAEKPDNILAAWVGVARDDSDKTDALKLAPNDALEAIFEALALQPEKAALRYLLALLLARRRVFQFEVQEPCVPQDANQTRVDSVYVYSPSSETGYLVPVVNISPEELPKIQAELVALLEDPNAALSVSSTVASPLHDVATCACENGAPFDSEEMNEAIRVAEEALQRGESRVASHASLDQSNATDDAKAADVAER